jgi:hypothetical protein
VVTATLASAPSTAVIAVARYSGVASDPIGAMVSGNTTGVAGACSGGSDTDSYSFNITTTVKGALVFGAVAMRVKPHTAGTDYIERGEITLGSTGSGAGAAVMDRSVGSPSSVVLNGTFSSTTDWAVIGLEIKPGSGGSSPTNDITVTPQSHDYGSVTTGTSSPRTFVVSNDGSADLIITSTTLIGTDANEFSITSGGGAFTLTPAQSRDVVVNFNPTSTGAKTATLRFENNDVDENPKDVSLSGNGVSLPVGNPPVALDDSAATDEDVAVDISVLANDSDSDGAINPTTAAIQTPPANGATAVNSTTGVVTYTPAADFFGTDTFTYTVQDDVGNTSNVATVTVTVNDINDLPVAVNDAASTPEGVSVNITVLSNDTDVDGVLDVSTVVIISQPSNGAASVNPTTGVITYTPNAGFLGDDSFTYTVRDDDGAISNQATVTVTVTSATGSVMIFSLTGDVPYSSSEYATLQTHIDNHNLYSPSEFLVHVGDIKSGSGSCTESIYSDVADVLKTSVLPVFVLIGDNEWTDCSNRDQAFSWWLQYFLNFEDGFCGTPNHEHQSVRPENFAFVMKGVLFAGVNLPSSTESGYETRLQQDADWVTQKMQEYGSLVRAVAVLGHAGPGGGSRDDLFFEPLRQAAVSFGKPVLFMHGNGHSWEFESPWLEANMTRVQVERGNKLPVQVTVSVEPNVGFSFNRTPWDSNSQPINREPCGSSNLMVNFSAHNFGEVEVGSSESKAITVTNNGAEAVQITGVSFTGGDASQFSLDSDGAFTLAPGSTREMVVHYNPTSEGAKKIKLLFYSNNPNVKQKEVNLFGKGTAPTAKGPVAQLLDAAYVRSAQPTSNFGAEPTLRLKSNSPNTNSYLKFAVSGLNGPAQLAKLRLFVESGGASGGTVYLVSNNFKDTLTPWNETGISYDNAPLFSGAALSSVGVVEAGQWVEFDVTPAITGNGVVSFGLRNNSAAMVEYHSKSGSNAPQLVMFSGDELHAPPAISSIEPISGSVGTRVTILGNHFYGAQRVNFNGVSAGSFVVDSNTQIRVQVPLQATTGRITVIAAGGAVSSADDFVIAPSPRTSVFNPSDDAYVRLSNPTATAATSTTLRSLNSGGEMVTSEILTSYLKFDLSAVTATILRATLRLYVTDSSPEGGELYLVANNYQGAASPWSETGLNWNNAPLIEGAPLAVIGPTSLNTWVELDVSSAVGGSGIYSFAIVKQSTDVVHFSSKEGPHQPELVIETSSGLEAAPQQPDRNISEGLLPERVALESNYPNPFNLETTIPFNLPQDGMIKLRVFNIRGQQVRTLLSGFQEAGFKRVRWDGRDDDGIEVGSGIYFVRLEVGKQILVHRITLQK